MKRESSILHFTSYAYASSLRRQIHFISNKIYLYFRKISTLGEKNRSNAESWMFPRKMNSRAYFNAGQLIAEKFPGALPFYQSVLYFLVVALRLFEFNWDCFALHLSGPIIVSTNLINKVVYLSKWIPKSFVSLSGFSVCCRLVFTVLMLKSLRDIE